MTRMLLSRDDILALYNPPGKETLNLLTGSVAVPDKPSSTDELPPLQSESPEAQEASKHEAGTGKGRSPGRSRASAGRSTGDQRPSTNRDMLTGLSNRAHFQSRCEEAVAEARSAGRKIALLLMGLDRFRDLNNALGHQVGDAVLIEIAQSLPSIVSANDLLGRFGGDEFALMLTDPSSESDVGSVASRMLDIAATSLRRRAPMLRSGASLGMAHFPEHGSNADELIQNADIALQGAKADGRGRAQVFTPQMRAMLMERLQQISAFEAAVEIGQVVPFYQPQMRLSDRRSYGFEALARWVLPNGDILYPAHFRAALDDPDAAILLGEHMLHKVSDDLRRWRGADMPGCKVSVNATGPELRRGDYAAKVARIFTTKNVPLSELTVEITESVLLDDKASRVGETLSDLRKLGVSIALDDFGTGFASLTHLKSYAVNQIKIDRSFISDLPSNTDDWAIVRATLGLARNLGIQTVAEGLEDWRHLKCLQTLGCDFGQGFFFSPAIPANEAEAYFRQHRAYKKADLYQFELDALPRTG